MGVEREELRWLGPSRSVAISTGHGNRNLLRRPSPERGAAWAWRGRLCPSLGEGEGGRRKGRLRARFPPSILNFFGFLEGRATLALNGSQVKSLCGALLLSSGGDKAVSGHSA